ncbi:hypothetical protein EJ03DRAFT_330308 [Teratosphaeria nubilosa]|uniref:UBC core domain-containing protein n=1 Tax=Teratosphaeria nubilosa TaxID=161662 RepID=A0A6G1L135_9PEZI|nr:hypothetical protein EJ03DRAFT_330308 [Teratosphaeria nubilosa]
MPRRQFIIDLQKAQDGLLPLGIADLQQGEDDGQFQFAFTGNPGAPLDEPVLITAMIPDLAEYPKSHEYMVFCADDAPKSIAAAVGNLKGTSRKTVFELVDIVAASLLKLAPDHDGDLHMPDSQLDASDDEIDDYDEDDDDFYGSDHEAFDMDASKLTTPHSTAPANTVLKPADRGFRQRIRTDLVTAKKAGFKVGILGGLLAGFNAFVTVSIRISKLGISEEAMQAWQVSPNDYLILLIQYPNGYKTNEELSGIESHRQAANLAMRVCVSKKYKPTLQDAIKAFTTVKKNSRESLAKTDLPAPDDQTEDEALRETFISRPLRGLLEDRLLQLLRCRSHGMDWRGAEGYYLEAITAGRRETDGIPDKYFEPEPVNPALPDIVRADHYAENNTHPRSFPLVAMQFMLRHFVRCTEFCLVCHRQLGGDIQAIKPYVCDSGLCLYQYMTLGFGPSIEHEILAQPYVVDLLISFCYESSWARRLKDFPDGLALMAPPIDPAQIKAQDQYGTGDAYQREENKLVSPLPTFKVGFDRDNCELIFHERPEVCPVKRGDWIVLKELAADDDELHCRISDITYFPTLKLDEVIVTLRAFDVTAAAPHVTKAESATMPKALTPAATPKWSKASIQIYAQDFDQLDSGYKCHAICKLLQTLPTVTEMQEWLVKNRPSELRHWVERISPAAISLLRWIIASNRACIMQVDGNSGSTIASQERAYGMKDHMQFRFAMGAPDKEQRFINEVRNTTSRLGLPYPTLFAFHGSPIYNWHMIIREGLHYKNTDHGRAYGHGVYHAKDAAISVGYTGAYYRGAQSAMPSSWPNSVLHVKQALALNEIVNAPNEFVSANPYYVVQHLDWIQTRYLFVQCTPSIDNVKPKTDVKPANPHQQDPTRTPRGISDSIVIPASAIKSRKVVKEDSSASAKSSKGQGPLKKLKGLGGFLNPIKIDDDDDDSASQATDVEDLGLLFEDDPAPESDQEILEVVKKPKIGDTDFVPGTLDWSTLPVMPMPEYAVSSTTKHLMKELQKLAVIQNSSTLADSGWYIDVEKIENVYQWIVELHSFHTLDKDLKLVADMKKARVTSIVLEIRFNADFPFSPPYVRVIRPRCLPFNAGGGGHIVIGGAMCMELLTNTGWSSVSSMESVLMQIRLAMAEEPAARLDTRSRGDYGTAEAAEGYIRACQTHGWKVPPGFKEMAYGSAPGASAGAGKY